MKSDNKEIWIKAGYEMFALSGQTGLKIEPLANKVGKNKSSFYHYFADIELYMDCLLRNHIDQSYIIAKKKQRAINIDPELIDIFVEYRIDFLFSRQLRINQNIKSFSDTLIQSNKIIVDAYVKVCVEDLNLHLSKIQIQCIFTLALENLFLQINADNINNKWLY